MKKIIYMVLMLCLCIVFFGKGIRNSKHNLASHGPGDLKSADTSMVCVFCHTSHNPGRKGNGPLWNREETIVEYTLYESSSLYSLIDQPDGASKLCLSCHDGTISLGHVLNRGKQFSISSSGSGNIPGNRSANLGRSMSDDHPVSFNAASAVIASTNLKHPDSGDPVAYDSEGKLQCTTCHDPHEDSFSKFLVKPLLRGQLCKTCHQRSGISGLETHDNSLVNWNKTGKDPWPRTEYSTVIENSCYNCHHSHNASGLERLLTSSVDSEICLVCHNGNTGTDISRELRKNFSHSVRSYNGVHDPVENILTASIHIQCVDCHNPHRVDSMASTAPYINGRLKGVTGMSDAGTLIPESNYEYEICLKCHGQDRYNKPVVVRIDQNPNLRLAFLPSNSSFHAVITIGSASRVPSLRPILNSVSRLFCTDCHNNNNARKNGGSGPNGPHGSTHENLLEKRYLISTRMPYQQSNYELCWKCHRPEVVMSENFSTFKYHKKHVDEQSTPCSVCHDPHGSRNNVGLINFDTSAVFPNLNGDLKFEVIGNKGYCYLQCHGDDHSPKEYEK